MILAEEQINIHEAIILDLTIRTLERDRKQIEHFKAKFAFALWIDEELKKLRSDLRNIKIELGKTGIKILDKTRKIDEYFIAYNVRTKGNDKELHYSIVALQNKVNEEVKKRLGLEYKE